MLTLDAWLAFARLSPDAATIWRERLAGVNGDQVNRLIAQVPPKRMTPVCRAFTARLLEVNRQRILDQDLT